MDRSAWVAAGQPQSVLASLADRAEELRLTGHAHEHLAQKSVRTVSHRGHEIVIRTRYEITVDGRPFNIQASVNNAGLVHYHGLPTRNFPSAVDLVKDAIDNFPNDFPLDGTQPAARPDHHHDGPHH